MYIINFNFIKPINEVNEFTDSHRAYVSKQYESGTFIMGGPKNPRTGGIVIANVNSEKEIRAILDQDPLIVKGVAEYSLNEFNLVMSAPHLASYIH